MADGIPASCQMLIKLSMEAASNLPVEFHTTWPSSRQLTSDDDISSPLLNTHVCCRNAWFLEALAMFHTRTVPSWPLHSTEIHLHWINPEIMPVSHKYISPVLCQLHWLPVHRRVNFKPACFVFSSLSSQVAPYLADDIHWHNIHAHTTHQLTGALLLPGHVFATASQHTCALRTLLNSFRHEHKTYY